MFYGEVKRPGVTPHRGTREDLARQDVMKLSRQGTRRLTTAGVLATAATVAALVAAPELVIAGLGAAALVAAADGAVKRSRRMGLTWGIKGEGKLSQLADRVEDMRTIYVAGGVNKNTGIAEIRQVDEYKQLAKTFPLGGIVFPGVGFLAPNWLRMVSLTDTRGTKTVRVTSTLNPWKGKDAIIQKVTAGDGKTEILKPSLLKQRDTRLPRSWKVRPWRRMVVTTSATELTVDVGRHVVRQAARDRRGRRITVEREVDTVVTLPDGRTLTGAVRLMSDGVHKDKTTIRGRSLQRRANIAARRIWKDPNPLIGAGLRFDRALPIGRPRQVHLPSIASVMQLVS